MFIGDIIVIEMVKDSIVFVGAAADGGRWARGRRGGRAGGPQHARRAAPRAGPPPARQPRAPLRRPSPHHQRQRSAAVRFPHAASSRRRQPQRLAARYRLHGREGSARGPEILSIARA